MTSTTELPVPPDHRRDARNLPDTQDDPDTPDVPDASAHPLVRTTTTTLEALPPRWQVVDVWGTREAAVKPARKIAIWIALGLMLSLLSGLLGAFIHERLSYTPPAVQAAQPVDVLARKLNHLLQREIEAGTVSLEENVARTVLTVRIKDMFPAGLVTVNEPAGGLLARVGREIARVQAKVRVTGHTDSLTTANAPPGSNQVISDERAEQVRRILLAAGVPPERVEAVGHSDTEPIAGNDTPHGRAINRRADVMVFQE
ncbi:OmpA family protein [Paraburkholderia bonniea]|uniref:OmpA family protein n=1 Tax=Paraburkholderia bonniea TaxID=2152891 RepID=UPI00157FD418|nr:OmpA family protein [Paraburkholderia bonniea]WJF89164.1 OmpA family protein [Paraburkholderia bonniea]WJF92480.1 OmpA family protein [Paraburkholderia bonniea]